MYLLFRIIKSFFCIILIYRIWKKHRVTIIFSLPLGCLVHIWCCWIAKDSFSSVCKTVFFLLSLINLNFHKELKLCCYFNWTLWSKYQFKSTFKSSFCFEIRVKSDNLIWFWLIKYLIWILKCFHELQLLNLGLMYGICRIRTTYLGSLVEHSFPRTLFL